MVENVTVLHVDDDPQFAELTATFLGRHGLDVESASGGEEAIAVLADDAVEIDCVVSDYEMPGMDGLEVFDAVRERRPDLPFILFTGKGSEQIASEAISAGVDDYLQKETGSDQYAVLANRIEHVVEGYRAERELERRVEQLRESERRFRTLISNLPGMVYRCRNERGWPMEFVSEGCRDLTGYDPEQLESGEVVWGEEVLFDAERDRLWGAVQEAIEDREPFQVEYRIRTADGETKWAWEQGRGVFEDDELVALEGFITDVTEKREMRDRLRRERDLNRRLIETSPVGIMVNDPEGGYVRINERAAEVLGVPRAEILDRTFDDDAWELRSPDGEPMDAEELPFYRLRKRARDADPEDDVSIEDARHSVRRPDGERRLLSVTGAPLYDDDGDLELLVFTVEDVTPEDD